MNAISIDFWDTTEYLRLVVDKKKLYTTKLEMLHTVSQIDSILF